jgi:hypothetical protein
MGKCLEFKSILKNLEVCKLCLFVHLKNIHLIRCLRSLFIKGILLNEIK